MKTSVTSLLTLGTLATQVLLTPLAALAGEKQNWLWTTPGRNGGPARESILSLDIDGDKVSGKISTPGRDG